MYQTGPVVGSSNTEVRLGMVIEVWRIENGKDL